MIKFLPQAMLKLLLTLLFCCLIVALIGEYQFENTVIIDVNFSDALEENSKDLIPDQVEFFLVDRLYMKREAIPEAGKKKGKESQENKEKQ